MGAASSVAPWDPRFFRRSALFWPIAPAAARLAAWAEWPAPEELEGAFPGEPAVRFELAPPRPRRARAPAGPGYDARIARDGVVPTRARSWHDLLNALVWATMPRFKRALHARQHALIDARLEGGRVPPARTPEQDAVAMIDEGGVVILCLPGACDAIRSAIAGHGGDLARFVADGSARVAVVGHGIYEQLVVGAPPVLFGAGYVVPSERMVLAEAEASLTALLTRADPIHRDALGSVRVDDALARAIASRADADA